MAKILIIDDRQLNRQFLTTLLGYQRHELREASDGAEGLTIAREQQPDLIISDVLMPTMDGFEFVRQLREEPGIGNTPVIFSTAHYLSRESQALAEKCGVTSIIYKPCEPQLVLETVAAVLSGEVQAKPDEPEQAAEFDREHLRLITDTLVEQSDELRDTQGKLTALIELSTSLASERNPEQLLNRYCEVAREVVGARWTLVVLLDRKRNAIQHLGVIGINVEDSARLRSALLETGVFKTVTDQGRAIRLSDVTSTPTALRIPTSLPRAESLLVVPLVVRGKTNGWICLADKLGFEEFSDQDEQLARALAAQMAVAYEGARLYSDTTDYAGRLEAEIAEREKAQHDLDDNRAQLAGIINSAMDAIITIDGTQHVVMFNAAAEKMFHCSAQEALGQEISRFMPERFRPDHATHIRAFGETGVSTRAMAGARTVYGRRADGEEFPLEASISQIEVAGQKLYTVIMRDITERKRAEDSLKESENRLRAILEAEPECVKLLAADGSLVDMNPAGLAMIEAESLEAVRGASVCELALPEHRPAFMDVNRRVFAGDSAMLEFEITGIKGTRRWLEMHATPLRDKDDAIIAALGITRDVTERRRAEEALRQTTALRDAILESAGYAIIASDTDWHIHTFNRAAEQMLGYTAAEMMGHSPAKFHDPDEIDLRAQELAQELGRPVSPSPEVFTAIPELTGKYEVREWTYIRKDGSRFPVELAVGPLLDSHNKTIGYVGIASDISERKQAEEALRESEEQFRTMANSIPQLAWMANADGFIFWYNQRWHDYTGKTPEEMEGWGWQSVHAPEAVPQVMGKWQDAIATGQPVEMEFPLLGADGKFRNFLTRVQPVKDSHGRVVQWFGTNTDVDELKRAEEALRESEEQFRALADHSIQGIVLFQGERTTFMNPAACSITGVSAEEALTQTVAQRFELIHPDDRARVIDRQRRFDRGEPIDEVDEVRIRRQDGETRWVLAANKSFILQGKPARLGIMVDITERRQAEDALKESEQNYRTLIESASDAIMVSDGQGRLLDVNAAGCRMFGYTRDELLTMSNTEIISQDEVARVSPEMNRLNNGEVERSEWKCRRKDGTLFPGEVSGTVLPNGQVLAILRDITERKRTEEILRSKNEELAGMTQQLWQASKLATMGELAASIAHELNNPLATVGLRTENLLLQIPDDDVEKRKPLEIIGQEVDRMAKLVNNLLQFSRRSHRQVSTVDPREEIDNSVEFVHYHLRNRKINVVRDFADSLPTIQADRQQLRQLFLNLFTNAGDAMPQGGQIRVGVASNGAQDPAVVIEVADTGEGISKENLERIWEPFFTTKSEGKGTGLGMGICRRIVEEHGGTMNIESEIGRGTTVRIVLPATHSETGTDFLQ